MFTMKAPMVPTDRRAYFGTMRNRARWLASPVVISALISLAACGETSLKAKAPAIIKNPTAMPKLVELPPSVVDAPIAYDIEPVLAAIVARRLSRQSSG